MIEPAAELHPAAHTSLRHKSGATLVSLNRFYPEPERWYWLLRTDDFEIEIEGKRTPIGKANRILTESER